MKSRLVPWVVLTVVFSCSARAQDRPAPSDRKYIRVTKYDPSRDGDQDLRDAVAEAQRSHKRILLDVGGEWCIWCHRMDSFIEQNPELPALLERHFILLKINYSKENNNQKLLSRYPRVSGYPHLFVLDQDGKLLHSQDTGELEEGKSYNFKKFLAFLKDWAPPSSLLIEK